MINANVFLEADEDTLKLESWPEEIRTNPKSMDKCTHLASTPKCITFLLSRLLTSLHRLPKGCRNARTDQVSGRLARSPQTESTRATSRKPEHEVEVQASQADNTLPQRPKSLRCRDECLGFDRSGPNRAQRRLKKHDLGDVSCRRLELGRRTVL